MTSGGCQETAAAVTVELQVISQSVNQSMHLVYFLILPHIQHLNANMAVPASAKTFTVTVDNQQTSDKLDN